MEQMRIVKEMREHDRLEGRPAHLCRPRFMVWENVPGAFSSAGGKDFAAVLEEILKVVQENAHVDVPEKGWTHSGCVFTEDGRASVAWRLHDAQFWGVPQRRKRIALVADFGGLAAPEILFERKGLSWNPEESGETREGTPAGAESGISGPGIAGTLDASYYKGCGERQGTEREVVVGKAISFQERAGKPGGGKGILIQDEHTGALSTLTNQSVLHVSNE